RSREVRPWLDRMVVTAVVTAMILLVLPLSHASAADQAAPDLSTAIANHLDTALYLLENHAGSLAKVRIAAFPSAEPLVNLYRAQHRLIRWERATRDTWREDCDFYLLPASESGSLAGRHLIVIYRDGDFLLARRQAA